MTEPQDESDRFAKLEKMITETAGRLGQEAILKRKRSTQQQVLDVVFKVSTAILAVTSPALVTYSTTAGVIEEFRVAAIIFTALAGAAATLQATFPFHENYVRNAIDALDLDTAKSELDAEEQAALRVGDPYERYSDLNAALRKARESLRTITIKNEKERLETLRTESKADSRLNK